MGTTYSTWSSLNDFRETLIGQDLQGYSRFTGFLHLRRFLSNDRPACLSFRPSSGSRQQLHRTTMRLLSLLEDERIADPSWSIIFRQSPKCQRDLVVTKKGVPLDVAGRGWLEPAPAPTPPSCRDEPAHIECVRLSAHLRRIVGRLHLQHHFHIDLIGLFKAQSHFR